MKSRGLLLLAPFFLAGLLHGAEKPAAAAPKAKGGGFVFSLLPKSFQRNPRLDFNILTEMSEAGRRAPVPTADNPMFYVAQAGRMLNTGVGAEGLKGPPREQIERLMHRALAAGGYRPSEGATQPPALVVVYNWGSSSFQPPEDASDAEGNGNVPVPEMELRKALLDRAMLLGGRKFQREVSDAMVQVDQKAAMTRVFAAPEGGDFMGSVGGMMRDPFDELRTRDAERERLVDELFSSSFFVVASAYDHDEMAKGRRVLLWRTKMTVNSLGVSIEESMPPLIVSAGPYLGRETKSPVVVTKRLDRSAGRVEIGEAIVVEDRTNAGPPAKPATAPAKK